MFRGANDDAIVGRLADTPGGDLTPQQVAAWREQLPILRAAVGGVRGWLHLEFSIPRLSRRVDAVVVAAGAVLPIEFKVGEARYLTADYEQAWDYGLDLKNFHQATHGAPVFPILCATAAPPKDRVWRMPHPDGVRPPYRCNAVGLGAAIRGALAAASADGAIELDGDLWGRAPYEPTPTIVEAARALYARHTVAEITRSDAGAVNLSLTAEAVETIIADARANGRKAIVFVTGVPGAGKTLVGLNVAARHGRSDETVHATLLSGNGPLVAVLQEALVRDEVSRRKGRVEAATKRSAKTAVKSLIQIVHKFRDESFRRQDAPVDRIVIFDEAQRAWSCEMLSDFMRRKKGIPGVDESEPQHLLGYVDRHDGWAVVVCLVGGGQEINRGEAGIGEWLEAVRQHLPHWNVHMAPTLERSEYAAAEAIAALTGPRLHTMPALHLATSMRSFRAERVSEFVRVLLDGDVEAARATLRDLLPRYPMLLTRDLRSARRWVRAQRRGSERAGLLASSKAQRLKPLAMDVRPKVDPVHWFLGNPPDPRSSTFLEDPATEFVVQGLEVDWSIVAWDADLRRDGGRWSYHHFRGRTWTAINARDRQRYLLNAYRVLLTRARQGMVVFVPRGVRRDRSRLPSLYDGTWDYLRSLGLPVMESPKG